MKTRTTKFMTLMTVAALGIFSAGTVRAAGNNDFYTQPPAGSAWEKADTEGTYASYTNGSDYVNIYKYSLEDVKTGIAKCNDTYEACYQTIYSEGNSLYMVVGYAKDADDIGDVREFVEYISYPGNPSLTRQADEDAEGNADKTGTNTSGQTSRQTSGEDANSSDTEENASADAADNSDDSDIISTSPMTLVDSDGNTIEINYILHKDYSCEYRGDDGMEYTDNGDETYTDENGKALMYATPSNLSPASEEYQALVDERVQKIKAANPDMGDTPIPVDLVTCSGSGLDPHISVAAAEYQIPRLAKTNNKTEEEIRAIIDKCKNGRFIGIFGEETVNVLKVNLMLDGILKE